MNAAKASGLALLACAGVALRAGEARADCAAPEVRMPLVRSAAPDEIVVDLNIGAALSNDGGKSWRLLCEAGYDPPKLLSPSRQILTPGGTLIASHFSGLLSSKGGCGWKAATGQPSDVGGPIDIALDASDPDQRLWTALYDTVYRSIDGGNSLVPVKTFADEAVLFGMAASPTDGKVLYLVTLHSLGAGKSERLIRVTSDGGASFRSYPSPFANDDLAVLAVDPTDPRRIFVRRSAIDGEEIVMSTDEGKTLTPVFAPKPADLEPGQRRVSFAFGGSPASVFLALQGDDAVPGSGRLYTFDGKGVVPVDGGKQPHFRCLAWLGGKLWACGNNLTSADEFAVGSSSDAGKTWTKVFKFGELCGSLPCAAASCDPFFETGACYPGLCVGGTSDGGGVDRPPGEPAVEPAPEPPGQPTGCCRTGGGSAPPAWIGVAILAMLLGLVRSRRRS